MMMSYCSGAVTVGGTGLTVAVIIRGWLGRSLLWSTLSVCHRVLSLLSGEYILDHLLLLLKLLSLPVGGWLLLHCEHGHGLLQGGSHGASGVALGGKEATHYELVEHLLRRTWDGSHGREGAREVAGTRL